MICLPAGVLAQGQRISGGFEKSAPDHIVLYGTRGMDHLSLDSVPIPQNGRFAFEARKYPPGFYQLGVNDTDRVDIILDPREATLEVRFTGSPLQKHIEIERSAENQRMWAYKRMSRNAQQVFSEIREARATASPTDLVTIKSLSDRENSLTKRLENALDSLIALSPEGQFAFAVRTDRSLDGAMHAGPQAVLAAVDLADPRILRSSSYPKAILLYLQSTPVVDEFSLHRACDTLLLASIGDSACWNYTRKHLVDLFATYGPDEVAQYMVDQYVVGEGARFAPDAELLVLAAQQLKLVRGAPAPDLALFVAGRTDTIRLSTIVKDHEFTGIFFYSSTCDHCHDQIPGLRDLLTEHASTYFHLIGIALDVDTAEFRAGIREQGITWPCYTEGVAWGAKAAKEFNVKATPSLFLVDRAGRIVAKPMDHQELRALLKERRER